MKTKKYLLPIAIIVLAVLIIIGVYYLWLNNTEFPIVFKPKINISTDKAEYERGEIVKITIKNEDNKDYLVYTGWGAFIYRFDGKNWTKVKEVICPCGAVCEMASPFETLGVGATIKLTWNQIESWCPQEEINKSILSHQVSAGQYRVAVKVQYDSQETELFKEFVIK